jgi:uncharacterized membrane protein YciS (DUF1049 family)
MSYILCAVIFAIGLFCGIAVEQFYTKVKEERAEKERRENNDKEEI